MSRDRPRTIIDSENLENEHTVRFQDNRREGFAREASRIATPSSALTVQGRSWSGITTDGTRDTQRRSPRHSPGTAAEQSHAGSFAESVLYGMPPSKAHACPTKPLTIPFTLFSWTSDSSPPLGEMDGMMRYERDKLRHWTRCSTGIILFCCITGIIANELEYAEVGECVSHANVSIQVLVPLYLFQSLTSFGTLMLLATVWQSHKSMFIMEKATGQRSWGAAFVSDKHRCLTLLFEFLVCGLHAPPGYVFGEQVVCFGSQVFFSESVQARYSVQLLNLVFILRLYLVVRFFHHSSRFGHGTARIVCQLYGQPSGNLLSVKDAVHQHPWITFGTLYFGGIMVFAYYILCFERSSGHEVAGVTWAAPTYATCVWFGWTVVSTVGFGDWVPLSVFGRAATVVLGAYGTIVVAMVVSYAYASLMLGPTENKVSSALHYLDCKHRILPSAVRLITAFWRHRNDRSDRVLKDKYRVARLAWKTNQRKVAASRTRHELPTAAEDLHPFLVQIGVELKQLAESSASKEAVADAVAHVDSVAAQISSSLVVLHDIKHLLERVSSAVVPGKVEHGSPWRTSVPYLNRSPSNPKRTPMVSPKSVSFDNETLGETPKSSPSLTPPHPPLQPLSHQVPTSSPDFLLPRQPPVWANHRWTPGPGPSHPHPALGQSHPPVGAPGMGLHPYGGMWPLPPDDLDLQAQYTWHAHRNAWQELSQQHEMANTSSMEFAPNWGDTSRDPPDLSRTPNHPEDNTFDKSDERQRQEQFYQLVRHFQAMQLSQSIAQAQAQQAQAQTPTIPLGLFPPGAMPPPLDPFPPLLFSAEPSEPSSRAGPEVPPGKQSQKTLRKKHNPKQSNKPQNGSSEPPTMKQPVRPGQQQQQHPPQRLTPPHSPSQHLPVPSLSSAPQPPGLQSPQLCRGLESGTHA